LYSVLNCIGFRFPDVEHEIKTLGHIYDLNVITLQEKGIMLSIINIYLLLP